MPGRVEIRECCHTWVPHGQLNINFKENAIRFPDQRTVIVEPRHLEALLAIPLNVSLSLENIAGIISRQRETVQTFIDASPDNNACTKNFYVTKVTVSYLGATITELNERTMEPLIQRASLQGHYRIAPQYSQP